VQLSGGEEYNESDRDANGQGALYASQTYRLILTGMLVYSSTLEMEKTSAIVTSVCFHRFHSIKYQTLLIFLALLDKQILPIHWAPVHETNYSSPTKSEVKMTWIYTSINPRPVFVA
jgi:hypothetical protein